MLVVDRLYDPRFAASTDPETGEEVLLALTPSQQQPLLTGQRYCRSVVLTSTVAAERHLQLLVQVRVGNSSNSSSQHLFVGGQGSKASVGHAAW